MCSSLEKALAAGKICWSNTLNAIQFVTLLEKLGPGPSVAKVIELLAQHCCCPDTYELVSADPAARAEVHAMYEREYRWALHQLERARQPAAA